MPKRAAAKLDSAAQESYTNIRFRIVPNKDTPALKVTERSSLGPRFIACAMGARASANGGLWSASF